MSGKQTRPKPKKIYAHSEYFLQLDKQAILQDEAIPKARTIEHKGSEHVNSAQCVNTQRRKTQRSEARDWMQKHTNNISKTYKYKASSS